MRKRTKSIISILCILCLSISFMSGCNNQKSVSSAVPKEISIDPTLDNINIYSIVNLSGSDCLIQVIGKDYDYLPINERTDDDTKNKSLAQKFQYIGIPYKQGLKDPEKFIAFNLEDVNKVIVDEKGASNGTYDLSVKFDEDPDKFGGTYINLAPNENERNEIKKKTATYSAVANIPVNDKINIGIANVTFSKDSTNDYLIFNVSVDNKSDKEFIINGKIDFQLMDKDGSMIYDSDDTLIDGKNILNFKLKPGENNNGLIAYKIPQDIEDNIVLVYKPGTNSELRFNIVKNPNPILNVNNVSGNKNKKQSTTSTISTSTTSSK